MTGTVPPRVYAVGVSPAHEERLVARPNIPGGGSTARGARVHGKSRKMTTIESNRSVFARVNHYPWPSVRVWIWAHMKVHTALSLCFGFGGSGDTYPFRRGVIPTLAPFGFGFRSLLFAVSRCTCDKSRSGEKTQKQIGGIVSRNRKGGVHRETRRTHARFLEFAHRRQRQFLD